MDIAKRVEAVKDSIVAFRRYVHQNAELGMQEFAATKRIVEELTSVPNIKVTDLKPGVLAVIKGKKPGRNVALRGDMDALPITEETGLPFASQNAGVSHACGHDLHVSILLGVAKVLGTMADEISGTVTFFFQPAEETLQGALHLLKHGAMDGVDAVFGVHVSPHFPVGTVVLRSGAFLASADNLDITVTGRSGHAGYPDKAIDSIVIAAHVVTALQTIVSRETEPTESMVVSLGTINGGTVRNIIAPSVTLTGTVRTLSSAVRDKAPAQIKRIACLTAESLGGKAEVNYIKGTPPVLNNPQLVDLLARSAAAELGEDKVRYMEQPTMGGEDFAFFMEKAPGVFFRVGTAAEDDPQTHLSVHNSKTRFDEGALPVGIRVMSRLALDYLAGK